MQLAKIVLCHPELAPRVALLLPELENRELKGFVERLLDALVRFHDLPPREALAKVPVARQGQLVGLADRIRLDGPDRVIGLATAISMVEAMTRDLLERQVLETRLGALQPLLAAADADDDHEERKRLLHEQKALVAALQALDRPAPPMAGLVHRAVAALPAPAPPPAVPPVFVPPAAVPAAAQAPERVVPAAASAPPPSRPPAPAEAEDPPWGGDDDDPWAV